MKKPRTTTKLLGGVLAATMTLGVGCAADDEPYLEVQCESGQCDLFDGIQDLRDDIRQIDSGDLFAVAGEIATDAINSSLEFGDFSFFKLKDPEVFALAEEADDDLTLGNIDTVVSGLVRRYGEKHLTTEVNRIRRDHLLQSNDDYYAEAAFSLGPELSPGFSWDLDVADIDGSIVKVGFEYQDLIETRVIAAIEKEADAYIEAPLQAFKAARGHILPVDSDDVLDMKPGELLGLSGVGTVALNFGAGVPIFTADPGTISYSVVFSAALRLWIKGERMDAQLIRLEGDDVVVDVGLTKIKGVEANLAIRDGWGVAGLLSSRCEDENDDSDKCKERFKVDVGPVEVELDKLADKALRRELNRRLNIVNAEIGGKYASSRITAARFRFKLKRGETDSQVSKALASALRGDLRAAQYLANIGDPQVITEFDLSHSGRMIGANAGLDLFGLSFYIGREWTDAEAIIQTPEGIMALLFDTLHRESGWFFSSHALKRTAIAGLLLDARSPDAARSESNLVVNLAEGDEFMEADKMLDHYDALLQSLAGLDALRALEVKANEIQRYVEDNCSTSSAFNACRVDIQTSPMVMGLKEDALRAFHAETGGLEPKTNAIVEILAFKRLAAQSVREFPAQWTGPAASIVLSYRVDDASMEAIASAGSEALVDAVADYLTAVEIDRGDSVERIQNDRLDVVSDVNKGDLSEMYEDFTARYLPLVGAEETVLRGLGKVGPRALELRFDVDKNNRAIYDEAITQSIAKKRAELVAEFFDAFRKEADGHRGAHIATYAILGMIPEGHRDVRINFDVDTSDGWSSVNEPYRVAGYEGFDLHSRESKAAPIESDTFDIDTFSQID